MHDQPAACDVEYPVFLNSGAGVELGFLREIEMKRGIRDFGNEMNVFGSWIGRERTHVPLQDDDVRLRFVGWIVGGMDVDGRFLVDKTFPEDPHQPRMKPRERNCVRPVLTHFADQLPVDEFQVFPLEYAGGLERGALRAGPSLTRRFERKNSGCAHYPDHNVYSALEARATLTV